MDINRGDRFETVVSMASRQWGITDQLSRRYGKDHPLAKSDWKQGGIVTTMIQTANGKTIVINMDMQLPRPYDNRWLIQGTRGLYNEQRSAVYLAGSGKGNNPEHWSPFGPSTSTSGGAATTHSAVAMTRPAMAGSIRLSCAYFSRRCATKHKHPLMCTTRS